MKTVLRVLGVVTVFFAGMMSLYYLQYLFDRGDLKKADAVIRGFKPAGRDDTLLEIIAKNDGVAVTAVTCAGRIISRYEGRVGMTCGKGSGDPYRFEVDVVGSVLRALDERTRGIIMQASP